MWPLPNFPPGFPENSLVLPQEQGFFVAKVSMSLQALMGGDWRGREVKIPSNPHLLQVYALFVANSWYFRDK